MLPSGFVGRLCVVLLFCTSFYVKYSGFDLETGGTTTAEIAPKLAKVKSDLETVAQTQLQLEGFSLPKIQDKHFVMFTMGVESIGSALFLLDYSVGADLLMLDILLSVPLNYDLSALKHQTSIPSLFLKDIGIFGSLLTYKNMKDKLRIATKHAAAVAGGKKRR
mmetsp:Transcript_581/g.689  ORF Transcript_581/g.689 Transcript_581/m.689 type:complete len:164 (+) Transcript_581:84-575(+)|eukprot:CAMPEP_0197853916 /NCGR_PEP_ID=MMETSP1438-20131217/23674_1 /TAXON_ID=1461541 /ORGANISM="Pterosperma sp., Strain CCMP1384" /LENGTH=163 /DNA_ID=CAMNT_0043468491 /DNA_START=82 /DNA_END=573 /DNA_ORIENTATION=-